MCLCMGRVHQHGPDARHILSDVLVRGQGACKEGGVHCRSPQSYSIGQCDAECVQYADYDFS